MLSRLCCCFSPEIRPEFVPTQILPSPVWAFSFTYSDVRYFCSVNWQNGNFRTFNLRDLDGDIKFLGNTIVYKDRYNILGKINIDTETANVFSHQSIIRFLGKFDINSDGKFLILQGMLAYNPNATILDLFT